MISRSEIRDGSVVRLVGCTQQMVVKKIEGEYAYCLWFHAYPVITQGD